jgi:hypothetical protein
LRKLPYGESFASHGGGESTVLEYANN